MKYILLLICFLIIPTSSAAHYVVGEVYDAIDSTSANGRTVVIWNTLTEISNNVTDIVGQTGNSGTDNVYFVDCEMLSTPCSIGDNISAMIFDQGDGYTSGPINVTITDAGFDIMPNMTLILQIDFLNLSLEDSYIDEIHEIDLTPAERTTVICDGIITGPNMDALIVNITSELFSVASSFYKDSNHGNRHYTNNSCQMNVGYGNGEQVYVNCSYSLQYYSLPSNWTCALNVTKTNVSTKVGYANSYVNSLLALELPDSVQFNGEAPAQVSYESQMLVNNAGNVVMNLSLSAYAITPGDNLSMSCPDGIVQNISLHDQGYNLTSSNPGNLSLVQFQSKYKLLNTSPKVNPFNLSPRQNDITNDATKMTYWRTYIPAGVSGSCTGNIVFGAVNLPET